MPQPMMSSSSQFHCHWHRSNNCPRNPSWPRGKCKNCLPLQRLHQNCKPTHRASWADINAVLPVQNSIGVIIASLWIEATGNGLALRKRNLRCKHLPRCWHCHRHTPHPATSTGCHRRWSPSGRSCKSPHTRIPPLLLLHSSQQTTGNTSSPEMSITRFTEPRQAQWCKAPFHQSPLRCLHSPQTGTTARQLGNSLLPPKSHRCSNLTWGS